MPAGGHKKGYLFQKGNKAAAGHGRPRSTEETLALKVITADNIRGKIAHIFTQTPKEINDLLNNKSTPTYVCIIARLTLKALADGDTTAYNYLLERCIGKVVQVTENRTFNVNVDTEIDSLRDKELTKLLRSVSAEHKETRAIDVVATATTDG